MHCKYLFIVVILQSHKTLKLFSTVWLSSSNKETFSLKSHLCLLSAVLPYLYLKVFFLMCIQVVDEQHFLLS